MLASNGDFAMYICTNTYNQQRNFDFKSCRSTKAPLQACFLLKASSNTIIKYMASSALRIITPFRSAVFKTRARKLKDVRPNEGECEGLERSTAPLPRKHSSNACPCSYSGGAKLTKPVKFPHGILTPIPNY